MAINIGQIVKTKYEESGVSMVDFAKRLNTSKQNIYNIFDRDSVDTELLLKIGRILNYNFFQDLADYQTKTSDRLLQENVRLISEEEVNGWKVKYYETLEKYTALLESKQNAVIDFSKISLNEPAV